MFRNKIIYALLIAELVLLCALYYWYHPVLLLIVALIFPIVLYAVMIIESFFFRYEADEENIYICRNEECTEGVKLINKGILPTGPVLVKGRVDGRKYKRRTSIKGMDSHTIAYPVDSSRCKIHHITVENIYFFDYIMLSKRNFRIKKSVNAAVIPKLYGIWAQADDILGNEAGVGDHYSEDKPGDDTSEIFEVRDYREGDNMSRVHWKLSVRQGRILVKDFSSPIFKSVLLIVNSGSNEPGQNVIFSLGAFCIQNDIELWVNGNPVVSWEDYVNKFLNAEDCSQQEIIEYVNSSDCMEKAMRVYACFDSIEPEMEQWIICDDSKKYTVIVSDGMSESALTREHIETYNMSLVDEMTVLERIVNE